MSTRDHPADPVRRSQSGGQGPASATGARPATGAPTDAPSSMNTTAGGATPAYAASTNATPANASSPTDAAPVGVTQDASLGELVGQLGQDLSRLMRAEIALAKAEAKEEAAQVARGAGMLAGAGVAGHLMLIFVSLAVTFGLGAWMPLGWAALIVGVVWAVAATALAMNGRSNLRRVPPPMDQTVETVKEDARWARKPHG